MKRPVKFASPVVEEEGGDEGQERGGEGAQGAVEAGAVGWLTDRNYLGCQPGGDLSTRLYLHLSDYVYARSLCPEALCLKPSPFA